MVTKRAITIFSWYVKWGNIGGAIPYIWIGDKSTGKYLQYSTSKWVQLKWWSYVSYAYFFWFYHIARAGYETKYGDIVKAFQSYIYALAFAIPVIAVNLINYHTAKLEYLINSVINVTTSLRRQYLKKKYQQKLTLVDLALLLGFLVALTYPLPLGLGNFFFPNEHFFLSNLMPIEYHSVIYLLPLAVLHTWYMYFCFSLCMFLIAGVLFLIPPVKLMLDEMSLGRNHYKSTPEMRIINVMALNYRIMQRFLILFNGIASTAVLAMQFVFKRQIYIGNVAIVFMSESLNVYIRYGIGLWTGLLTIAWAIIITVLAMPHDASARCLKTWKYSVPYHWTRYERRLFLKIRKSCLPTSVQLGQFSYARKDKLMKFVYSVSRGTLEALLTYEEARNS